MRCKRRLNDISIRRVRIHAIFVNTRILPKLSLSVRSTLQSLSSSSRHSAPPHFTPPLTASVGIFFSAPSSLADNPSASLCHSKLQAQHLRQIFYRKDTFPIPRKARIYCLSTIQRNKGPPSTRISGWGNDPSRTISIHNSDAGQLFRLSRKLHGSGNNGAIGCRETSQKLGHAEWK